MNFLKSKIELLKLLSLPIGLLVLSLLGLLVIKSYVAEETSAERVPTNFNGTNATYNVEPDDTKKRELLKIKGTSEAQGLKKPHGAVQVNILCSDPNSLSAGVEAELVGIFKVDRDVDEVSLVWHLPDSVEQLSGSPKDIFYKMHAGEERRVSIHVQSHSAFNQQIHLEVNYLQGTNKIGSTTQFNTVDQITIDKIAKNQMNSSQSRGTKIWQ